MSAAPPFSSGRPHHHLIQSHEEEPLDVYLIDRTQFSEIDKELNLKLKQVAEKIFYAKKDSIKESEWEEMDLFLKQSQNIPFPLIYKEVEFENFNYKGQTFNNSPYGEGKAAFKDGSTYVGQWQFSKFCGRGTYTYPNTNQYVGQWKNDHFTGSLLDFKNNLIYTGFFDLKKNYGQGTLKTQTYHYTGGWCDGKRDTTLTRQQAICQYADTKITSHFKSDFAIDDQAQIVFSNAYVYLGNISNSIINGQGRMNYPDGSFYEGLWRDGKRHGLGVLVDNQGIYVEAVFDEDLNCKPLRVFKKNANGEIILLKTEESLIIEEAQKMLKIHQTPVFLAVQQVAEPLSLNKNNVNE